MSRQTSPGTDREAVFSGRSSAQEDDDGDLRQVEHADVQALEHAQELHGRMACAPPPKLALRPSLPAVISSMPHMQRHKCLCMAL